MVYSRAMWCKKGVNMFVYRSKFIISLMRLLRMNTYSKFCFIVIYVLCFKLSNFRNNFHFVSMYSYNTRPCTLRKFSVHDHSDSFLLMQTPQGFCALTSSVVGYRLDKSKMQMKSNLYRFIIRNIEFRTYS